MRERLDFGGTAVAANRGEAPCRSGPRPAPTLHRSHPAGRRESRLCRTPNSRACSVENIAEWFGFGLRPAAQSLWLQIDGEHHSDATITPIDTYPERHTIGIREIRGNRAIPTSFHSPSFHKIVAFLFPTRSCFLKRSSCRGLSFMGRGGRRVPRPAVAGPGPREPEDRVVSGPVRFPREETGTPPARSCGGAP